MSRFACLLDVNTEDSDSEDSISTPPKSSDLHSESGSSILSSDPPDDVGSDWEDVKASARKIAPKPLSVNGSAEERASPFGSGAFGGFSRTNAAEYLAKKEPQNKLRTSPSVGKIKAKDSLQTEPISKAHSEFAISPNSRGGFDRPSAAPATTTPPPSRPVLRDPQTFLDSNPMLAGSEVEEDTTALSPQPTYGRQLREPERGVADDPTKCGDYDSQTYMQFYEYLNLGLARMQALANGFEEVDCCMAMDCGDIRSESCRALDPDLYQHVNTGPDVFSRKVFLGGVPLDFTEAQLFETFSPYGQVDFDWPNKRSGTTAPDKGYAFLMYKKEESVHRLVESCEEKDGKLFIYVDSPMFGHNMPVQIRPWRLADKDYVVDVRVPVHLRRVIFVGGVPRPMRAVELAHMMDRLYGPVVCAGIDTDIEFQYPKGAGRVAFAHFKSYIRAIRDGHANLIHGATDKNVEIKPYVLDDQVCDECLGERNGGRFAPYFCPNVDCLQYYCELCWDDLHGNMPADVIHRPVVKEAGSAMLL